MSARKLKVVLTRRLPDAVETRMRELFDAELNLTDRPMSRDELAAALQRAEVLAPTITDHLDAELIAGAGEQLKMIANFGAGVDHIDIDAAVGRGIIVTNTPGVLTEDTADLTMSLILAVSRRVVEGAAVVAAGQFEGWSPTWMCGRKLWGKRLGIVGMGRIGQALAIRARACGMEIHYYNRTRLPAEREQGAIHYATVEALLPQAQFLSLHCPLTPQTAKLMDARRLALLPRGAILVNTARGGVVDDDAVLAALDSGQLAAAGLDVFDGEPNVDRRYLTQENAFILPHMGSATVETRNAMGFRAIDNLKAVLIDGAPPPHRVRA